MKTNRRDATTLARLHRAGELTPVWVPDAAHEAIRDLVRARARARRVLGKARQHLQGFLLRHGRIYRGARGWTRAYRRWLTTVRFDHARQTRRDAFEGFARRWAAYQDASGKRLRAYAGKAAFIARRKLA